MTEMSKIIKVSFNVISSVRLIGKGRRLASQWITAEYRHSRHTWHRYLNLPPLICYLTLHYQSLAPESKFSSGKFPQIKHEPCPTEIKRTIFLFCRVCMRCSARTRLRTRKRSSSSFSGWTRTMTDRSAWRSSSRFARRIHSWRSCSALAPVWAWNSPKIMRSTRESIDSMNLIAISGIANHSIVVQMSSSSISEFSKSLYSKQKDQPREKIEKQVII